VTSARAVYGIASACVGVGVACSLGLDRSLISRADGGVELDAGSLPDGALDGRALDDAADGEVGDARDAAVFVPSGIEACTTDEDCKAVLPCDAVGHCGSGGCYYMPCEHGACATSTCDDPGGCGPSKPHPLHVATLALPDATTLGCSVNANACFAVIYPFAFVGTSDPHIPLLAVRIDAPVTGSAQTTPVQGLDFAPVKIVASGRRLYVIGAVELGNPYLLPVGAIDVASGPTGPLEARAVRASYSEPTADLYPSTPGHAFVVRHESQPPSPAAVLDGLPEAGVALQPSPVPTDEVVFASSGTRLISTSYTNGFGTAAYYTLVEHAGTPLASASSTITGSYLDRKAVFAEGQGGSVVSVQSIYAGYLSVTATWIVGDATASGLVADGGVQLGYLQDTTFPGKPASDTIAVVDPVTAIAASIVADWRKVTVSVISRATSPPTVSATKHADVGARNPENGDAIGAGGWASIGYVVSADAQGAGVTIDVYDTRCEP
jgi:hypothetical protein